MCVCVDAFIRFFWFPLVLSLRLFCECARGCVCVCDLLVSTRVFVFGVVSLSIFV